MKLERIKNKLISFARRRHADTDRGPSVIEPSLVKATQKSGTKTFSVFGNCQANPIGSILQSDASFKQEFEFVPFSKPAFALRAEDIATTMEHISKLDVLITQNVSEKFGVFSSRNLIAHLKPGARVIRIPNAYFSGYTPEVTYFRAAEPHVTKFCDYHDANLLKFYFDSPDTALERVLDAYHADNFYSNDFVLANAQASITELQKRELDCDVYVSDFIERKWQQDVLFYSMNHPNRALLNHICEQIAEILEYGTVQLKGNFEHLGNTRLPIYNSISQIAQQSQKALISVQNKSMSAREYFEGHYQVLRSLDQTFLKNAYSRYLKAQ